MITYREISSAFLGEIKEIYSQAGWTAYLNDSEKLKRAFDRSLFLAGAVTNALPGILVQIILIPILVITMEKAKLTLNGTR